MKFESLKNKLSSHNLTPEKLERLVHLFLLGAWALTQYSVGNKFYGLFIIAFFVILVIARPPSFLLLAASVLVIVLFNTPTIDTLAQLKLSNLSAGKHPRPFLTRIFSPNSGKEVLPIQVQQMLSLLQEHQIASYQLSNQLDSDPLLKQRIIESAWPIKMDSASPYLLSSLEETITNPACVVIDQRKDVALADCH